MPELQVSRDEGVLTVTFDRPDVLNALTRAVHAELQVALETALDPDVRAVVITGSGRGFCVGQDIEEIQQIDDVGEHLRRSYHPTILAINALAKPVVAAINGIAAGAGISLALACPHRIAAQSARFIPGFIGIGLVPDSGFTYFLPRLIGSARAFEWTTTNRELTATEARAWGMIDEVVDDDALAAAAHQYAIARAAKQSA